MSFRSTRQTCSRLILCRKGPLWKRWSRELISSDLRVMFPKRMRIRLFRIVLSTWFRVRVMSICLLICFKLPRMDCQLIRFLSRKTSCCWMILTNFRLMRPKLISPNLNFLKALDNWFQNSAKQKLSITGVGDGIERIEISTLFIQRILLRTTGICL